MPAQQSIFNGTAGNGSKSYLCSGCGSFVSSSDRLLKVNGSDLHFFVNPEALECVFNTFLSCPGAVYHGPATIENSWFSGYRWRFALCGNCHQHLGWHYSAVSPRYRPLAFWGLLIAHMLNS